MATSIPAGQFKAKCLKLLDQVAATRESLIVTKHGKPVAQLVPIAGQNDFVGSMRGSVLRMGDIVSPLDVEWEATK
jgi:prevent-host-death family protein